MSTHAHAFTAENVTKDLLPRITKKDAKHRRLFQGEGKKHGRRSTGAAPDARTGLIGAARLRNLNKGFSLARHRALQKNDVVAIGYPQGHVLNGVIVQITEFLGGGLFAATRQDNFMPVMGYDKFTILMEGAH